MKKQNDRTARTKRPPFTKAYVDRNGHARFYLRKKGMKPVALPGLPWSPEFMEAREAALNGQWDMPAAGKVKAGSLGAAIIGYLASSVFGALGESTKVERRILETLRKDHGTKSAAMPTEALQLILADKTPAVQRNWKKTVRGLVNYCISVGLMKTDPLAGIKLARMKKTGGIHAWSEEEIAQFREHWAPGTKPSNSCSTPATPAARWFAWDGSTSTGPASSRCGEGRRASPSRSRSCPACSPSSSCTPRAMG